LDWSRGDERAIIAPAVRGLAKLPVREICMFHEFLRWRFYTLDTREHARNFAPGVEGYGYIKDSTPFSTDGFVYCRAMVVAKRQAEYERVLADPTLMAREGFELYLYLPQFAYERKAGADYDYESEIDCFSAGVNRAGWLRE
jgi:hypothetical protein